MTTARIFVTGTGTGVGKTWVSRGIARAAMQRGLSVAATKPYETGCAPNALDALALAKAAGRPELAEPAGLYRAEAPLCPWAATLAGEAPPPSVVRLARETRARAEGADLAVVEGAGGLLVPIDETSDVADLAVELDIPLLLVARDGLGVLSLTLTAVEAAKRRDLDVCGVVLTPASEVDPSCAYNQQILRSRLASEVLAFPHCDDDDDALGRAAESSGVMDLLLS